MNDFTKDEFVGFWGTKGYIETWDGYEKNWTPEIMEMIKTNVNSNSVVLEIGCGNGYWTNRIQPLCNKLYAIDLIPNPQLHKDIIYIENDNQQFNCYSIETGSIDFVFCFGVFCHISLPACEEYFQDILRVLKPDGKALLMYGDQNGLRKRFNNSDLTCEEIGWKFNTYEKTMEMISKYPVKATQMLEYRDTLLLINKVV
jgi:SAM-dependent methyltransferase